MSNTTELGGAKTVMVLAVVVGCFAVLFLPMFSSSGNQTMGRNENVVGKTTKKSYVRSQPSMCCDVISEKDTNAHLMMNEICKTIMTRHEQLLQEQREQLPKGKKMPFVKVSMTTLCRNEVLQNCGVDILGLLNEDITLEYKKSLGQLRSLNTSLCIKINYGVDFREVGLPRKFKGPDAVPSHIRPERPFRPEPDLIHPALRERGRAIPTMDIPRRTIEREARPGPVPGIRPPLGQIGHMPPPPKTTGSMGIIMPFYTIAIAGFFLYTIIKLYNKKNSESEQSVKSQAKEYETMKYEIPQESLRRSPGGESSLSYEDRRRMESPTVIYPQYPSDLETDTKATKEPTPLTSPSSTTLAQSQPEPESSETVTDTKTEEILTKPELDELKNEEHVVPQVMESISKSELDKTKTEILDSLHDVPPEPEIPLKSSEKDGKTETDRNELSREVSATSSADTIVPADEKKTDHGGKALEEQQTESQAQTVAEAEPAGPFSPLAPQSPNPEEEPIHFFDRTIVIPDYEPRKGSLEQPPKIPEEIRAPEPEKVSITEEEDQKPEELNLVDQKTIPQNVLDMAAQVAEKILEEAKSESAPQAAGEILTSSWKDDATSSALESEPSPDPTLTPKPRLSVDVSLTETEPGTSTTTSTPEAFAEAHVSPELTKSTKTDNDDNDLNSTPSRKHSATPEIQVETPHADQAELNRIAEFMETLNTEPKEAEKLSVSTSNSGETDNVPAPIVTLADEIKGGSKESPPPRVTTSKSNIEITPFDENQQLKQGIPSLPDICYVTQPLDDSQKGIKDKSKILRSTVEIVSFDEVTDQPPPIPSRKTSEPVNVLQESKKSTETLDQAMKRLKHVPEEEGGAAAVESEKKPKRKSSAASEHSQDSKKASEIDKYLGKLANMQETKRQMIEQQILRSSLSRSSPSQGSSEGNQEEQNETEDSSNFHGPAFHDSGQIKSELDTDTGQILPEEINEDEKMKQVEKWAASLEPECIIIDDPEKLLDVSNRSGSAHNREQFIFNEMNEMSGDSDLEVKTGTGSAGMKFPEKFDYSAVSSEIVNLIDRIIDQALHDGIHKAVDIVLELELDNMSEEPQDNILSLILETGEEKAREFNEFRRLTDTNNKIDEIGSNITVISQDTSMNTTQKLHSLDNPTEQVDLTIALGESNNDINITEECESSARSATAEADSAEISTTITNTEASSSNESKILEVISSPPPPKTPSDSSCAHPTVGLVERESFTQEEKLGESGEVLEKVAPEEEECHIIAELETIQEEIDNLSTELDKMENATKDKQAKEDVSSEGDTSSQITVKEVMGTESLTDETVQKENLGQYETKDVPESCKNEVESEKGKTEVGQLQQDTVENVMQITKEAIEEVETPAKDESTQIQEPDENTDNTKQTLEESVGEASTDKAIEDNVQKSEQLQEDVSEPKPDEIVVTEKTLETVESTPEVVDGVIEEVKESEVTQTPTVDDITSKVEQCLQDKAEKDDNSTEKTEEPVEDVLEKSIEPQQTLEKAAEEISTEKVESKSTEPVISDLAPTTAKENDNQVCRKSEKSIQDTEENAMQEVEKNLEKVTRETAEGQSSSEPSPDVPGVDVVVVGKTETLPEDTEKVDEITEKIEESAQNATTVETATSVIEMAKDEELEKVADQETTQEPKIESETQVASEKIKTVEVNQTEGVEQINDSQITEETVQENQAAEISKTDEKVAEESLLVTQEPPKIIEADPVTSEATEPEIPLVENVEKIDQVPVESLEISVEDTFSSSQPIDESEMSKNVDTLEEKSMISETLSPADINPELPALKDQTVSPVELTLQEDTKTEIIQEATSSSDAVIESTSGLEVEPPTYESILPKDIETKPEVPSEAEISPVIPEKTPEQPSPIEKQDMQTVSPLETSPSHDIIINETDIIPESIDNSAVSLQKSNEISLQDESISSETVTMQVAEPSSEPESGSTCATQQPSVQEITASEEISQSPTTTTLSAPIQELSESISETPQSTATTEISLIPSEELKQPTSSEPSPIIEAPTTPQAQSSTPEPLNDLVHTPSSVELHFEPILDFDPPFLIPPSTDTDTMNSGLTVVERISSTIDNLNSLPSSGPTASMALVVELLDENSPEILALSPSTTSPEEKLPSEGDDGGANVDVSLATTTTITSHDQAFSTTDTTAAEQQATEAKSAIPVTTTTSTTGEQFISQFDTVLAEHKEVPTSPGPPPTTPAVPWSNEPPAFPTIIKQAQSEPLSSKEPVATEEKEVVEAIQSTRLNATASAPPTPASPEEKKPESELQQAKSSAVEEDLEKLIQTAESSSLRKVEDSPAQSQPVEREKRAKSAEKEVKFKLPPEEVELEEDEEIEEEVEVEIIRPPTPPKTLSKAKPKTPSPTPEYLGSHSRPVTPRRETHDELLISSMETAVAGSETDTSTLKCHSPSAAIIIIDSHNNTTQVITPTSRTTSPTSLLPAPYQKLVENSVTLPTQSKSTESNGTTTIIIVDNKTPTNNQLDPNLNKQTIAQAKLAGSPTQTPGVSVVGIEETASLSTGERWDLTRTPTPTFRQPLSPIPHRPPTPPEQIPSIYLEGPMSYKQGQELVVREAQIELEANDDYDNDEDYEPSGPVILSGKVTLSVISSAVGAPQSHEEVTEAPSLSLDDRAQAEHSRGRSSAGGSSRQNVAAEIATAMNEEVKGKSSGKKTTSSPDIDQYEIIGKEENLDDLDVDVSLDDFLTATDAEPDAGAQEDTAADISTMDDLKPEPLPKDEE